MFSRSAFQFVDSVLYYADWRDSITNEVYGFMDPCSIFRCGIMVISPFLRELQDDLHSVDRFHTL